MSGKNDMTINGLDSQTTVTTFDLGQAEDLQVTDYHDAHGFSNEKTSFLGASVNFYKACVGSGVLGIPYAYTLGWGQGLVMFTILPIMIIFTTILIVQNSSEYLKKEGLTLTETVRQIVGSWGERVTIFFLVFMQWGACASYLLFFIQFFNYAIYHTDSPTFGQSLMFLALAFCVIIPLIFVNDLGEFAKFSVLSSGIVLSVLILVMIQSYIIIFTDSYHTYNKAQIYEAPIKFSFSQICFQAGISMYTFEGIGLVFSVKRAMKKEQEFPKVVYVVGLVMIIQNLLLGMGASFAFGQDVNAAGTKDDYGTQQIVLLSLNPDIKDYTMQILYSIALAITFPLQLFPIFQVVEGFASIKKICQHKSKSQSLMRRTSFRFCQVIIIAIFALSIPSFATLISFVGGIGGSVLQFVVPLMVYIKTAFQTDSFLRRLFIFVLCGIGMILGAGATIQPFILATPTPPSLPSSVFPV